MEDRRVLSTRMSEGFIEVNPWVLDPSLKEIYEIYKM